MQKICGVRFTINERPTKFIDEKGITDVGDLVVAETELGIKLGEVVRISDIEEGQEYNYKPIIRLATDQDILADANNTELEKKAFKICKEKVKALGLDMKLFRTACTLDRSKMYFMYTSNQPRVDYTKLVQEMGPAIKMRVQMVQVTQREEAKYIGGIGICGRQLCCQGFMTTAEKVAIKDAKEQGLNSGPAKYSGNCGKLYCCLKHELPVYEYASTLMPKNNTLIVTPDGIGKITVENMLKQTCSVKIGGEADFTIKTYDAKDLRPLTDEERAEYTSRKNAEHENFVRNGNEKKGRGFRTGTVTDGENPEKAYERDAVMDRNTEDTEMSDKKETAETENEKAKYKNFKSGKAGKTEKSGYQ